MSLQSNKNRKDPKISIKDVREYAQSLHADFLSHGFTEQEVTIQERGGKIELAVICLPGEVDPAQNYNHGQVVNAVLSTEGIKVLKGAGAIGFPYAAIMFNPFVANAIPSELKVEAYGWNRKDHFEGDLTQWVLSSGIRPQVRASFNEAPEAPVQAQDCVPIG